MNNKRNRSRRYLRTLWPVVLLTVLFWGRAEAAPGYEGIAGGSEMASAKQVGSYGMVPIYGFDVNDGTYEIEVDSSSHFFKVEQAYLTVENGEMSAVLKMYSNSYECIYPGTAQEAAAADREAYYFCEDVDDWPTITMPVEALNKELDCATFSVKKQKWYDRKILFDASVLPEEALTFTLPDYTRIDRAIKLYDKEKGTDTWGELQARKNGTDGVGRVETEEELQNSIKDPEPVEAEMEDGTYSIDVALSGGSGRASVSSPTWFYVKDGKAYAKLLWSSSYYDYMLIGEKKYLNETRDGSNSTFTIPITVFNQPMEVVADTTAMGDPVEIDYTLTFYPDTIGSKNQIPQEAAIHVFVIALCIVVFGGILNYYVKKRRKR